MHIGEIVFKYIGSYLKQQISKQTSKNPFKNRDIYFISSGQKSLWLDKVPGWTTSGW